MWGSTRSNEDEDKGQGKDERGLMRGASEISIMSAPSLIAQFIPEQQSESERLYPLYMQKLQIINYSLVGMPVMMTFLLSLVQYVSSFLPNFLASQRVMEKYMLPTPTRDGALCVFNAWVLVSMFLLCVVYGTALIGYIEDKRWKCCAPLRFIPIVVILVYATAFLGYYVYVMANVSTDIEETMKADFKNVNVGLNNTVENLRKTQLYYSCCGVKSFKEWEKYYEMQKDLPVEDKWHGEICNGTKTSDDYFLNHDEKIVERLCKVPWSCWELLENGNVAGRGLRNFRQVINEACLPMEINMALGVTGFLTVGLCFLIAWATFTYLSLWRVIRAAKSNGVDLVPTWFAQCL